MPTVAERVDAEYDSVNLTLTEHLCSWTDDLPVCLYSGIGSATNQVYRVDGIRKEEHEFEDRSFHFCLDEDTFFYGVFDGQSDCKAVEFASQRMPAEILLGQLKGKTSDQEIKDVLQQAFLTVETTFFQSIDNLLAEKEDLRLQLQGLRTCEALKQYPEAVHRLNAVKSEISSETTAVVALIHRNRLYVANVGNCRAVLCKEESGLHKVYQLSVDHDLQNDDEILRLSQLGISLEMLHQIPNIKSTINTRCIGNYAVKGGYKEFGNMSEAAEEPVIADPEVVGGIEIDKSFKFLFLMSKGLYRSLEQATGTRDSNHMIAKMLIEEFDQQSTLNGVAQAVVDKIVRIHHDAFMKNNEFSSHCLRRDDVTLLIRNFNQPLAARVEVPKETPDRQQEQIVSANSACVVEAKPFSDVDTLSGVPSIENSLSLTETENRESVSSSSDSAGPQRLFQSTHSMSLDDEGRIKPYVDFSEFYDLVEEAYQKNLVPEDWRRRSGV